MELIETKQNFEVNHDMIYSSTKLTDSNQKLLLLILLSNHVKYNKRHYSFTLSEELCKVLNVSNPTFRKSRDRLELLNLISVKVKIDGKKIFVEKTKRKHCELYYYFNWQRLSELGFIKLEKTTRNPFNFNDTITFVNSNKMVDEVYYNLKYYELNSQNEKVGIGVKCVEKGIDLKRKLKRQHNSYIELDEPLTYIYIFHGLHKDNEDFLIFN